MIKIINSQTRYWFKRDIQTIKKALRETAIKSPLIFIIVLILTFVGSYLAYSTLNVVAITFYFMAIFPTVIVGYFLYYIIENKGYKIKNWPPYIFPYEPSTVLWHLRPIVAVIIMLSIIFYYLFNFLLKYLY